VIEARAEASWAALRIAGSSAESMHLSKYSCNRRFLSRSSSSWTAARHCPREALANSSSASGAYRVGARTGFRVVVFLFIGSPSQTALLLHQKSASIPAL
jgi:hypothetical protein